MGNLPPSNMCMDSQDNLGCLSPSPTRIPELQRWNSPQAEMSLQRLCSGNNGTNSWLGLNMTMKGKALLFSSCRWLTPAWHVCLPFLKPLSTFWGLCPHPPTALTAYVLSSSLMVLHEIFLKYWCQMNFLKTTVGQTSLLTQDHNGFITECNSNSVWYSHNLTYFRLGIFMTKPYLLPQSSPSAPSSPLRRTTNHPVSQASGQGLLFSFLIPNRNMGPFRLPSTVSLQALCEDPESGSPA